MTIRETIEIHGTVEVLAHCAKTEKLLWRNVTHNTITNYTRTQLVAALRGVAPSVEFTHVALGTGSTPTAANQTALADEVFRDGYTALIENSPTSITFQLYLPESVGNGYTYTEIGLFTADMGGNMGGRALVAADPKTTDITLTFNYTIAWQ